MEVVVLGLVCLFIGMVIGKVQMKAKHIGTLRIDRSQPDEPPLLFLDELNCYPEDIAKKNYVTLKVLAKNFISENK